MYNPYGYPQPYSAGQFAAAANNVAPPMYLSSTSQAPAVVNTLLSEARGRYPQQPMVFVLGETHDLDYLLPVYESFSRIAPTYNFKTIALEAPNTPVTITHQYATSQRWDHSIHAAGGLIPFMQNNANRLYGWASQQGWGFLERDIRLVDVNHWLWSRNGMNVVNGDHPFLYEGATIPQRDEHLIAVAANAVAAGQSVFLPVGSAHLSAIIYGLRARGVPVYSAQFLDERPQSYAHASDRTIYGHMSLANELGIRGAVKTSVNYTYPNPNPELQYWQNFARSDPRQTHAAPQVAQHAGSARL